MQLDFSGENLLSQNHAYRLSPPGDNLRPTRSKIPHWLVVSGLVLITIFILVSIWDMTATTSMGENDFVGYWSATYLFRHGENPYDPSLMEITQKTKLRTSQNVTIMAWNPPTLFVILLPLAWFYFLHAKFLWLIINLVLVIITCLMLARVYHEHENARFTATLLLFFLVFPPVVSGFYMGQVTFLILFGLVACMWMIRKDMWFEAGMVLILTTIKPHLVVLSVVYLLLLMARKRRFGGWIGLVTSGLFCILILFAFRPDWLSDLLGLSIIAPVNWATPTIGGWLSSLGVTEFARYLIVLFLPLPAFLAWNHNKYSVEFSIAALTLLTIPLTFFGWNYDQSMLLIPITLVFTWLAKSDNSRAKFLIILMIGGSLGVNVYLRILSSNDMIFLWVPLFWWLIFLLAWRLSSSQAKIHE